MVPPQRLFNTKSRAQFIGSTGEALVMNTVVRPPFVCALHPPDFSFTTLIAKAMSDVYTPCLLMC